jgi:hypothetical protein
VLLQLLGKWFTSADIFENCFGQFDEVYACMLPAHIEHTFLLCNILQASNNGSLLWEKFFQ